MSAAHISDVRGVVAWLVVGLLWLGSWSQVRVWRSDLTLWAHAAQRAPLKPRPALNYGIALLASGQTSEGVAQLRRAQRLATLPHVPVWDARSTRQAVAANLRALREASRR